VASMKRYLVDERHRIDLHDLVTGEVERVMATTSNDKMPVSGGADIATEARHRLGQLEATTEILRDLFIVGARWSGPAQDRLWAGALERLANLPAIGGSTVLINLRRYPAVLVLYAGGIAATAARNFKWLRALLLETLIRNHRSDGNGRPAVEELYPQGVLDSSAGNEVLTPGQRTHTPLNNHLFNVLREPLREAVASDEDYADQFDRFEYLLALVYVDLQLSPGNEESWFPVGRFGWRNRWTDSPQVVARMSEEIDASGNEWIGFSSGLFASVERFRAAAAVVAKALKGAR